MRALSMDVRASFALAVRKTYWCDPGNVPGLDSFEPWSNNRSQAKSLPPGSASTTKENCVKVSVRLNHGFWKLGAICVFALGFQVNTFGQIDSAVSAQGSQATAGEQTTTDVARQAASRALYKARAALAVGDLEMAMQMAQLAKTHRVDFAALGDAPASVESLIAYHQELATMQQRKDAAYETKAATFLLQQANMILAYQDFETAELLANQASRFNANFAGQALNPQSMKDRISSAKQAQSQATAQVAANKQQHDRLMAQARYVLDKGDLASASSLVAQAKRLSIPDSMYGANDVRPWQLELKIQEAMQTGGEVMPASFEKIDARQMVAPTLEDRAVVQADYYPETDTTRNVTVSGTDGVDRFARNPEFNPIPSRGMQLYRSGLKALQARDKDGAREYFQMAWQYREQLDGTTQQTIQDHLGNLTRTAQATLQEDNPFDEEESFSPFSEEDVAPAEPVQQRSPFDEDETSSFEPQAASPEPVQQQVRDFSPPPPPTSQREIPVVREPVQTAPSNEFAPATPLRNTPPSAEQLEEAQELLQGSMPKRAPEESSDPLKMVDNVDRARFDRMQREVFRERAAAQRLQEESPRKSLEKLTRLRTRVGESGLNDNDMRPLLNMIDRQLTETQEFIDSNLTDIVNTETNTERLAAVELDRQRRYDVEQQIQNLVEDFNNLMDEQRYAEADMVARQAAALNPESEISTLMREKAKFALRVNEMERIQADKEEGVYNYLKSAEKALVIMDEEQPYQFGDRDTWARRAEVRAERLGLNQYGSEAERRIWNVLKKDKVQGNYTGTLNDVVNQLSKSTGVNIIFDNVALEAVGVATDRPVDVPINNPISLESSLNIILGGYGLVFVVEDEVIKVTSRDAQKKDVKRQTYYIGDLVTPIQNFTSGLSMNFMTPNGGFGQNGIISQANMQNPISVNQAGGGAINPVLAAQGRATAQNVSAMGQQLPGGFGGGFGNGFGSNYGGSQPQSGTANYNSIGPQTTGGVSAQDFDPLIDLIKSTIDPEGWDDTNGDGTIQAYVPNLSLIVSQTQEVQDQIQDLLVQLRELNDVQIVVEVKFISLTDTFFERIGVDFDFALNDDTGLNAGQLTDVTNPSAVIGLDALGAPAGNLDIGFMQDSFTSSIPQFGGFDAATAASFGFAILSDIEVFFLLSASKGDTRSNTVTAPTVTMFNGQSANVVDASVRPFVTSVVPVVGDFAAAQQPVITLLPEGTSLNVNAVVSNDRKFVRLTLVPFFSQVTEVETFTFDGSTTTRQASESFLDELVGQVTGVDPDAADGFDLETVEEGVTIQLPVLAATTISTVVSVPDGGTVLLGGIKRTSEGRTERGVPFLSNIPYVNRLFKNVGIGRETSNLMMMVTPRIIIQSEEEAAQVGSIGLNN